MNIIYQYIVRHKLAAVAFLAAWLLIAIWGVSRLRFEEDITKVLPQNDKTNLTSKVLKQLNFADKISVMLSAKEGSLADMQAAATAIVDSLNTKALQPYIAGVQGIVADEEVESAWQFVNSHLPLFLTEDDYTSLAARMQPDSLNTLVQAHYKTMLTPAGMVAQSFIRTDPFGLTFRGLQKLQALNIGTDFKLTNGFLTTKDEQHLLFFVTPRFEGNDTEHNTALVQQLEQLQAQLQQHYGAKLQIHFFGAPFISVSNATQKIGRAHV